MSSRGTLPVLALLALLLSAGQAQASFPGSNGQIAYVKSNAGNDIYTTGGGRLTTSPGNDRQPAWSPDGLKITFTSDRDGNDNIYVINPDGTGEVRITSVTANDNEPAWSPDGSKIVFVSQRDGNNEIYTMNADGTGATRLTTDLDSEQEPAWSPDGTKIAFDKDVSGSRRVYVMNANGSGAVALTSGGVEGGPVWSPDGSKIAYTAAVGGGDPFDPNFDVFTMNADGSNQTALADSPNEGAVAWAPEGNALTFVVDDYQGFQGLHVLVQAPVTPHSSFGVIDQPAAASPDSAAPPDWQPVVTNYARPQGATPMRVSLVPAFKACTSPNTSHQGPLSGSSCVPAAQASDWLTVGTPDANGAAAKSTGSVVLSIIVGNPSTPADEADLQITASVKDVREKAGLADYTGQLQLVSSVRITDKRNSPGSFGLPGTVVDAPFGMTFGCVATADTTVGSTCAITTTADALLSNSFKEGKRAIWRFGQMQLFDGGPDGVASTNPNTLFETDGVFVP